MTTENQRHIPEGWKECELGAVIVEKAKSTIKVSDAANFGEYLFFTSGDSILLHDRKIIEGENLFLATGGVANIKYFEGEASYSTDTFAISTNEESKAQYLYYYLLSKVGYINKNYFEGSGLKHLQKKDFRKHVFVLPTSPTEQQKIASILSKLDEAITQTEQLIAKYKKIKEGLMHDLLTRGIDEQGNIRSEETHKFKDSPLGRIPEEWVVEKLECFCDKIGDGTHTSVNFSDDGEIPFLFVSCISPFYIDFAKISHINNQEYEIIAKNKSTKTGTVLYSLVGSYGNAITLKNNKKVSFQRHIGFIETKRNEILPEFLTIFLNSSSGIKQANDLAEGNAQKTISLKALRSYVVVKPSIREQRIAIEYFNTIKTLLDDFDITLLKLNNQKSGLMHDLLTGNVRVSNRDEQKEQNSNVNVGTHKTQAHNQHIEDAVLIGAIVNAFYSDKYTLGRKKIQKLLYLVRRHQEASVACFKKKAAGPYADEIRYRGGEPIAKANKYITTKTNNLGTAFSKGENIEKALTYIEKWEMLSDIDWLLTQFKYTKVDQLELIATIDMARCDLEKEGISVSLSTIKHLIVTNKEWKEKLKKDYFDDFSILRGIDESYKLFGE